MNKSQQLMSIIESLVEYAGKYYACFTYKNYTYIDSLHITHTYFGNLTNGQLYTIISIIDDYFKDFPFQPIPVVMQREDFLGPNKETRVLRPVNLRDDADEFLPELRKRLYPFNASEFKDKNYIPHTSTDKKVIDMLVDGFGVYSYNTCYANWR